MALVLTTGAQSDRTPFSKGLLGYQADQDSFKLLELRRVNSNYFLGGTLTRTTP